MSLELECRREFLTQGIHRYIQGALLISYFTELFFIHTQRNTLQGLYMDTQEISISNGLNNYEKDGIFILFC